MYPTAGIVINGMSKPVESFSDYVDNVLREFRTMSTIGRQSGGTARTNLGPAGEIDVAQLMDDEDVGDPAVANAFKAGDKTQLMRMLMTKRRAQLKTIDTKADALRKITQLSV